MLMENKEHLKKLSNKATAKWYTSLLNGETLM
jgi:hypothetical protein